MLWHVWQKASQIAEVAHVFVACDNQQVFEMVESWGGKVILTDPSCVSGTHRVATIMNQIPGELIIILQADEPLFDPEIIREMIRTANKADADIYTPIYTIEDPAKVMNPNVVKVVTSSNGRALYFSRSTIPYVRDCPVNDWPSACKFQGHIGIYGYPRKTLENYKHVPNSYLENAECLEQLRFLEAGYSIQTFLVKHQFAGVDTAADLLVVQKQFKAQETEKLHYVT